MSESILYINGAAYPPTKASICAEEAESLEAVGILTQAGHKVTRIGRAWSGFYMRHVEQAFRNTPEANLVIVNVHGNIKDDKHYLGTRGKGIADIFAEGFYKGLARFSPEKPLNIFMFSCGSGNGCIDAVKQLPLGSTLVNATQEGTVSSYFAKSDFLNLAATADKPFAESLFLNLLAKGYDPNTPHYPQLSVSTTKPYEGDIWSMWDLARTNVLETDTCIPEFEQEAKIYLRDYFSENLIAQALRTLELYCNTWNPVEKQHEGTPVKARFRLDDKDFANDVRKHGLYGAICAIGYYANRRSIGAFQIEPEVSSEPVHPSGSDFSRLFSTRNMDPKTFVENVL